MNHYDKELPSWQSLLGRILRDYMVGKGFEVTCESLYLPKEDHLEFDAWDEDFSSPTQHSTQAGAKTKVKAKAKATSRRTLPRDRIEAVFLTRKRDLPDFFPADGLDCLSRHNLLLFNPQPLEPAYLHQMTDCFWDYARFPSGKVRPSSPVFMVISPSGAAELDDMPNLKPIMPGVYEYHDLLSRFLVLIIDRLMDIPENHLWRLFSFDATQVSHALSHYRPNRSAGKLNLPTLVDKYAAEGILTGVTET